jgi:hypothetical protein
MATQSGRAWKEERTTDRKYSGGDDDTQPKPGEREKFWVSGYTRKDGKKVAGYYKQNPAHKANVS